MTEAEESAIRQCDDCATVVDAIHHRRLLLLEVDALRAEREQLKSERDALAKQLEGFRADLLRKADECMTAERERDECRRFVEARADETLKLNVGYCEMQERTEKLESALKEYARPMLFVGGEFTLHSGGSSNFKLECDALSDEEIAVIARALRDILPPFGYVVGVPRGGLKLAEAMRRYITSGPLLIVDDVLTTGRSMEEMALKCAGTNPVIGAVIFARSKCSSWITPLFTMTSCQSVLGVGKER